MNLAQGQKRATQIVFRRSSTRPRSRTAAALAAKRFLGNCKGGADSVRLRAANGHFVRRHPPKSLKLPDATDKTHPPSTDDQLEIEGVADIFDASSAHVRRLVDADGLDGLGLRKRATGSAPCSIGWAPSPSPEVKAPRSR